MAEKGEIKMEKKDKDIVEHFIMLTEKSRSLFDGLRFAFDHFKIESKLAMFISVIGLGLTYHPKCIAKQQEGYLRTETSNHGYRFSN